MNVYLHVGIKLKNGKNNGVPAQTIVNMFIDIVLNLGAILKDIFT